MQKRIQSILTGHKGWTLAIFAWLLSVPSFAQSPLSDPNSKEFWLLLFIGILSVSIVLVLLVLIYLLSSLKSIIFKQAEAPQVVRETLWEKFNKKFIAGEMLPVEREEEIMLDHAYDGIYELNNHMPPWLKYFFILTIAFSVVYLAHYMVFKTGPLQIEEYEMELAVAKKEAELRLALAKNNINEDNAVFTNAPEALASAQTFYMANCVACHKADGGGGVGPNLTDEYWVHGGSLRDIFKVIKYGVKEKGMIPWEDKMTPEDIQNMASYIIAMQGTTPAEPKEPQGEKYVPEQKTEANDTTQVTTLINE